MTGYIYSLYDTETLAVLYIGSSISPDTRLRSHKYEIKNASTRLYEYLLETGISFDLDIKERVEFSTKKELLAREAFWIDKYKKEGIDIKNTVLYKNISGYPEDPNDRPFPIRLGELKTILQMEAYELGISLHRHILNIIQLAIQQEGIEKSKQAS